MNKLAMGAQVVVYDRFRFAIALRATFIRRCNDINDDVVVRLVESNCRKYPIGCEVRVAVQQIRRYRGKAK